MVAVFKHVLNPRQKAGMGSPFSIVTALVDQIDFTGKIFSNSDIRISGETLLTIINNCGNVNIKNDIVH